MLGALTPKPLHTYVTPVLVGCWVVLVMELGAFDRIDRIDHIIPRQGSDHLGRCFLLLLPRFIQWLTDYFSLFSMFYVRLARYVKPVLMMVVMLVVLLC